MEKTCASKNNRFEDILVYYNPGPENRQTISLLLVKRISHSAAFCKGFVENKFTGEAFKLFRWMLKESALPNYATTANILPVCAGLEEYVAYHFGKEIHCYVLRRTELAERMNFCL